MALIEKSRRVVGSFLSSRYTWLLVVFCWLPSIVRRWPQVQEGHKEARSISGTPFNSHSGLYKDAAVASDHGPCSTIGAEIMGVKGGSTVDAAIATMICNGATHLQSSGIGGGHYMIIYDKPSGETVSVIAGAHAPLAATQDMFVNDTTRDYRYNGKGIAVPNELLGLKLAWDRFGRLPWASLFQPTIKLIEKGFPVSANLAYAINKTWGAVWSDSLRSFLSDGNGNRLKSGDILKRPLYAKTLRTIAQEGVDAFYSGSLTDDIVKEIHNSGGIITREDLNEARNNAKIKPSVESTLDHMKLRVLGVPPPSSGAVVQFILKILDGFKLTPSDIESKEAETLTHHRIIEAVKFGFGKRSTLGDEDFVDVAKLLANLTTPGFAEYYRQRIRDDTVLSMEQYEPDFGVVNDQGTSHLSVVGPDGSAVAVTSSIHLYFGCKIRGEKTGIIYNSLMDDFSTPGLINNYGLHPSPSNFIAPKKRPLSSMSPTIILDKDGDVVMAVGASGGSRIISAMTQTIVRNIWLGIDLRDAVDRHRFHNQIQPGETEHETDAPSHMVSGLYKKGHPVLDRMYQWIGACQVVRRKCKPCIRSCSKKCIEAVSDGRKGGYPDGPLDNYLIKEGK